MANEEKKLSVLERFDLENERILKDARTADKEARAKIAEYEKKLEQAKTKRDKAAAIFDKMRADFERIEAESLKAARARIENSAAKKEDALSGKIPFDQYAREGMSQAAIETAARKETDGKMDDLLKTVRAKSLEVLALDVEVGTCEKELQFLNTYPASFMLERMRQQLKSLEQTLIANTNGFMPTWTDLDTKKAALARAQGKGIENRSWDLLDLAGVRRMRFSAEIPDSALPALNKIIEEMEVKPGCRVVLRYTALSMSDFRGLDVAVWR